MAMVIKELNISEFGCFKNRQIHFDAGMNIVCGENESGKSTVLLFIKFMLYGLGRKSASNIDRERSLSWSGHTAAGSMTFELGDKEYRIERIYNTGIRGGTNETVELFSLYTGEKVKLSGEPGEYLFGVGKEVFESTAFVSQMRVGDINGEKTSSAIQNLLTSADESIDTKGVLRRMDAVRVDYRHKNKVGGSLAQTEMDIAVARRELERATDDTQKLELEERRLANAVEEYSELVQELERCDTMLSELNRITVLKRIAECRKKEQEYKEAEAKLNSFRAENTWDGFFPTREHITKLSIAGDAVSEAEQECNTYLQELECLRADAAESAESKLGRGVLDAGGIGEIMATFRKMQSTKRTLGMLSLSVLIVAVIACAALFFAGFPIMAAAACVVGAAIVVPLSVTGGKLRLGISALLDMFCADAATMQEKLLSYIEAYEKQQQKLKQAEQNELMLERAEKNLVQCRVKLDALLEVSGAAGRDVEKEAARLAQVTFEFEALTKECDTLRGVIESEKAALGAFDEAELLQGLSLAVREVSQEDITECKRKRDFLASKRVTYDNKILALRESTALLRANRRDPIVLADELSVLEAKYAHDCEYYEALALAMESIERAGDIMSGDVMPQVAYNAGELLARVTDSKYNTVRTTSRLGLSLEQDGFGVSAEHLSGGTRDAAYLALRLALFSRIFGNTTPPFILDEAFCQLDDKRTEKMLTLIGGLNEGVAQTIIFTSQSREAAIARTCGLDFCESLL